MTTETRFLIDLSDLLAIEFTCPNEQCRSKVLHSVANFRRPPANCPNCNDPILKEKDGDYAAIQKAMEAIRHLMERNIRAQVRLELAAEPTED